MPLKGEARKLYDRSYRRNYKNTEKGRRSIRDFNRRKLARLYGYLPAPFEKDCPPRPDDRLCQCCGGSTERFHLDHCHDTGAFRGWVCSPCNTGVGIMDNIERLEKRIAFLRLADKRHSMI